MKFLVLITLIFTAFNNPTEIREDMYKNKTYKEQKCKHPIHFKFDMDRIKQSKQMVWYGWDWENVKLNNPRRRGQEESIIFDNIPSIISNMNDEFKAKKIGRKMKILNKDHTYIVNDYDVTNSFQNIKSDELIEGKETYITLSGLGAIISKYKLTETEGTGFAVIMENMHKSSVKSELYMSAYITFFDIETRDLLYVVRMKGKPGGYGFTNYWTEGLYECLAYFFKYHFRG